MDNVIVLSSAFNLGDIVTIKVNLEHPQLIITGFVIHAVDEAGQVIHYSLLCSDGIGNILEYKSYELEEFKEVY